jgi:hypothetical protein
MHRVKDAAVNWFKPIARIRKGARHDHAHGVVEIGALHLIDERNWSNVGGRLLDAFVFFVSQGRKCLLKSIDERASERAKASAAPGLGMRSQN